MNAVVVQILGGLVAFVAGVGPAIFAFVHEHREHRALAATDGRELVDVRA